MSFTGTSGGGGSFFDTSYKFENTSTHAAVPPTLLGNFLAQVGNKKMSTQKSLSDMEEAWVAAVSVNLIHPTSSLRARPSLRVEGFGLPQVSNAVLLAPFPVSWMDGDGNDAAAPLPAEMTLMGSVERMVACFSPHRVSEGYSVLKQADVRSSLVATSCHQNIPSYRAMTRRGIQRPCLSK